MAANKIDSRQITYKGLLSQLSSLSVAELDNLLKAIGDELIPPLRLSASSTPNLVVSVGSAIVSNSETNRNQSISHIGALLPNNFTSGTITFPAASGGTITVSPGNNATLTVSSGNYIKVLIYMDATGALNVLPGVQNAVEASATVLAPPKKTLPIGYVTLQNVGGVIQNVVQAKIVQFGSGAGAGSSGSGSGVGSDLSSLTFKAEFNDEFDDIPSGSASAVDITTGKTDSNIYSAANAYYRVAYDASKTVTGTGTSMNLSGTPSFTVKAGDMLIVAGQARRIVTVTTQTSYVIESAFTANPTAAAANVSQAVYTLDLNNIAIDGLAISSAFSTVISQAMVDYEDTTAQDDVIFDPNVTPVIGLSASSDGTNYSNVAVRPTNLTDSQSIINLPTAGTNLYIRFFSNKTSGSGFVNILKYHAYFHRDLSYLDGSQINQSYGLTNGAGTEVNVSSIGVVSGKTRIKKTWTYPVGVNAGTTNGSLKVYLNGQKIPRFVDSVITADVYYKEIDSSTIELDKDYSGFNYSFEIIQDVAVVDATDANSTNITALQEIQSQGFQSFVNENARLSATASAGSPAAGTFYSSIVNRASIPDLTANLKAQMGIERIMTQSVYQLQNEFGTNGEPVWASPNDTLNQIRFVGNIVSGFDTNGFRPYFNTVGDFVEITFYGTGLNWLSVNIAGATWITTISVDGNTTGTYSPGSSTSSVLYGRGYSPNTIVPVASGLSLGVHTVRISFTTAGSATPGFYGFEVLNESSTIKLNPGSAYANGSKLTLSSQQSLAYNSGFESGTLGTRGGRVVVYQKSDSTIAKAVQPVDTLQAVLTSANHQNEEVARTYNWREFGSGRTDDFSTLVTTLGNRMFTLDDGTTALIGSQVRSGAVGADGVAPTNGSGNFISFTFVGTGLDIELNTDTATRQYDAVNIDGGSSIGVISKTANSVKEIRKVASGLPYGTHTVKFAMTGASGLDAPPITKFIVYQPKKPTIPSSAIELADYNVMATFVANTTAGAETMSTGVLRKISNREFIYVDGTGGTTSWSPTIAVGVAGGFETFTDRSGAYFQYTFWGTGFDFRFDSASNRTSSATVTINGATATTANFPTMSSSVYGGGSIAFTSGVLNQITPATVEGGLVIQNLPLGLYTVRVTNNVASQFLILTAMDVITPIHSAKSNIYADLQNTLPVGSCSISDNRKTSAVKEVLPGQKAWAQASHISGTVTNTSTAYVPLADAGVTIKTGNSLLDVSLYVYYSQAAANTAYMIYLDGVPIPQLFQLSDDVVSTAISVSSRILVPVAAGVHRIDVYWKVNSGTSSNFARVLSVTEK